jgi:predicted Zn-dependent protease
VEDGLRQQLGSTRSDYPAIAEVLTAEYMRLYRLPEAREILNRWIELDGDDPEPWVRRAWVAEHQLDFDAALADYRKVLALESERHPVRLRVAEILFKVRKPAEALPELERLQQKQPADVSVALTLSRCRRELGQVEQAAAALDALPASSQQEAKVVAERAQIALARSKFTEAETLFRTALRDMPREREVLYGLQQCLSRLDRTAEAEEIRKVLTQVDADGRRMGVLITALTRNPADADLRYEGALIFLRNGVVEDGIRWLEMTVEANPRHRQAHEKLAEHYDKQGMPERAALHREASRRRSRKKEKGTR